MMRSNHIEIWLFVAILFAANALLAQSSDDLAALKQAVGAEKYSYLEEKNPDLLAEVAYINRHGYHLSEMGGKDFSDYPDIQDLTPVYPDAVAPTELSIANGEWNLIAYPIEIKEREYQYFRVGGSDKVLVILPKKLIEIKKSKAASE